MRYSFLVFLVVALAACAWADSEQDRIILTHENMSQGCTDGSLGKLDCNNCFCTNGVWACTLKGCITPPQDRHRRDTRFQGLNNVTLRQMCHVGSRAHFECNDCDCVEERWKCEATHCNHQYNEYSECGSGDHKHEGCKTCSCCCGKWRCTESDRCTHHSGNEIYRHPSSVATPRPEPISQPWPIPNPSPSIRPYPVYPTPRPTYPRPPQYPPTSRPYYPNYQPTPPQPPRYEPPRENPEEIRMRCRDGESKMRECNSCICMGGYWACTTKACGGGQAFSNPGSSACQSGLTKEVDCNKCICMSGFWACTDKTCPIRPVPLITDPQSYCTTGATKEEDCNSCMCLKQHWACTKGDCMTYHAAAEGRQIYDHGVIECNLEETKIVGCNDCVCLKGQWACTELSCGTQPSHNAQVCTHGETKMESCNHCNCFHGHWVCTQKNCGVMYGGNNNPQHGHHQRSTDQVRTISLTSETVGEYCNNGEFAQYDCNTCHCSNNRWACTRMGCGPITMIRHERAIPDDTNESHTSEEGHKGGHVEKRDANTSEDTNESKTSEEHHPKTKREICTDGASKQEECNTCTCTHGTWNCSKKACRTKRAVKGTCRSEGSTKKDACNTCTCLSGKWQCTHLVCPTTH